MTIFTVGQSPIICSNMAEMGTLLTTYPDLEPMTPCTVMSGSGGGIELYRLQSGSWVRTYPDQATIDWLTMNSTDIGTLQTALSGKADSSSLSILATSIATELAGKATTASVTSLATDITKKASVYLNGAQKTNPKFFVGSATVTGGNAVFYLTDTGLVGGNGIFTNVYLDAIQPFMIDSASPPAFGQPTYNSTTKALTIPCNKAQPALSVLGLNVLGSTVAANGTLVKALVLGD